MLNEANPTSPIACDGGHDVVGIVPAPEQRQHPRHHRLHAEADAVDAGGGVGGEQLVGDVVGVALHRDLGAGCHRDRGQHAGQQRRRDERRRAAADEHRRRPPLGMAGERADDVHAHRLQVVADEVGRSVHVANAQ